MGFSRGLELTWQHGFIESIRVVTKDAAALGMLLSTRAACAVQGITFTKGSAQLLEAPEVTLPRSLRYLALKGHRVTNLVKLDGLPRLRALALQGTTKITSLREIGLRFSERIRNVTPLHGMRRLEEVDVVYTGVAAGARRALEASLPSFKRRTSYTPLYCEETLDVGTPDVTGRW